MEELVDAIGVGNPAFRRMKELLAVAGRMSYAYVEEVEAYDDVALSRKSAEL